MGMKQKIMIVDDAEINRQILMAILGDKYEYVQAENWLSGSPYAAT